MFFLVIKITPARFLSSFNCTSFEKALGRKLYKVYGIRLNISDAKGGLDPEAPPANYGRRRSRAVLYQLSGHYKQDNKHKIKLNNVSASILIFSRGE